MTFAENIRRQNITQQHESTLKQEAKCLLIGLTRCLRKVLSCLQATDIDLKREKQKMANLSLKAAKYSEKQYIFINNITMRKIFAVMNTSFAVVKRKPAKHSGLHGNPSPWNQNP